MLINSVNTYLSVRRSFGFKLETEEKYLRRYADFATSRGETHVSSKTAVECAGQASSENERAANLAAIIRFARFMRAEDVRHEVPPSKVYIRRRQRRIPSILTDAEVAQVILKAEQLGPKDSLRPHTYSMLFGLLASTGLRISEALSLRLEHISSDGLVIRETKFKKSRIVPLHSTVTSALDRYLKHRQRFASDDDHVFISHRERKKLSRRVVLQTFHEILAEIGINEQPDRVRPRLHDYRHRFAIKSLESCPDSRDRIARHMLALSTYMGHSRIESTYWYLDNTPQLMKDIVAICETFFRGGTAK